MASGNSPADPNFFQRLVFVGIWDNFHIGRRVWTLESHKAFVIIAIFSTLVAFAGSRSWVILRHVYLKISGTPVRIHDEANAEPLLDITQSAAIRGSLITLGQVITRISTGFNNRVSLSSPNLDAQSSRQDPGQPIWLGVVALFNLVLFLCIGIAIPVLVTEGAFGAPVVTSVATDKCTRSISIDGFALYMASLDTTDAVFKQCFDDVTQACSTQYHLVPAHTVKKRLAHCPFPSDICQNQTMPFEISHFNISASEVGPWVSEVETWFMKSILNSVFRVNWERNVFRPIFQGLISAILVMNLSRNSSRTGRLVEGFYSVMGPLQIYFGMVSVLLLRR
jgi:hypothetical protein